MQRKGFTLLEILLALGIVGIISAVLMRVIAGVMPDVGKAKFLRAYTATRTIVSQMISDTTLYPDSDETDPNYGFANTEMPSIGLYKDPTYSGANKFTNIFADKLGLTASSGSFYSPRDGVEYTITSEGDGKYKVTFKTADGTVLGYAEVEHDGNVTCGSEKGYCVEMEDLRRDPLKG